MKEYEKQQFEFDDAQKYFNNAKIKLRDCKNKRNKSFREKYKNVFLILDFSIILIILFNFGAVLITNVLVVKKSPTMEFYEANEVQASRNNYEKHPDGDSFMNALFFQMILWSIIIGFYLFQKYNAYEYFHIGVLVFVVLFYVLITGYDFINDFGYLIGKMLWGI